MRKASFQIDFDLGWKTIDMYEENVYLNFYENRL